MLSELMGHVYSKRRGPLGPLTLSRIGRSINSAYCLRRPGRQFLARGAPRWARVILDCVAVRCRLLGLYGMAAPPNESQPSQVSDAADRLDARELQAIEAVLITAAERG